MREKVFEKLIEETENGNVQWIPNHSMASKVGREGPFSFEADYCGEKVKVYRSGDFEVGYCTFSNYKDKAKILYDTARNNFMPAWINNWVEEVLNDG